MATITNIDKILKSFTLGSLCYRFNEEGNPFLTQIETTMDNVWGAEVRVLPSCVEVDKLEEVEEINLPLRTLFSPFFFSEQSIKEPKDNASAIFYSLSKEISNSINSNITNYNRMLFGDGSGLLATTVENKTDKNDLLVIDSTNGVSCGDALDIYSPEGERVESLSGTRILEVDPEHNTIKISFGLSKPIGAGYTLYLQGCKDKEVEGLKALFDDTPTLYGMSRDKYRFLCPYKGVVKRETLLNDIYCAINELEFLGSTINFIVCSPDALDEYLNFLNEHDISPDFIELENGTKVPACAGIPIVTSEFVPSLTMYLLNSEDFKLHQLCDWRWLEDSDGSVIRQVPGSPTYRATLVKFANLYCENPSHQGKLVLEK